MNATKVREGLEVPYEAYEELEPRCVEYGGAPVVLHEQVRFRFTIIMSYN